MNFAVRVYEILSRSFALVSYIFSYTTTKFPILKKKKEGNKEIFSTKETAKRTQREFSNSVSRRNCSSGEGRGKKKKRFTREEKINERSLEGRRQRLGFHLSERIIRGRVKTTPTLREIHGDGTRAGRAV